MNFDHDFEPMNPPPNWPGPIALIGLAIIVAIIIFCTSCSSTFYGPDGKPTAMIHGDYTYQRSAAGDVSISLKHSPVIRAGGVATSQAIAAAGTVASAAILAAP